MRPSLSLTHRSPPGEELSAQLREIVRLAETYGPSNGVKGESHGNGGAGPLLICHHIAYLMVGLPVDGKAGPGTVRLLLGASHTNLRTMNQAFCAPKLPAGGAPDGGRTVARPIALELPARAA